MVPIIFYLLLNLIIGGLTCFYGLKLYFPILMLNVFGFVVTLSLSLFDLSFGMVVATVGVATLAAVLAYYFYKLGVFLMGGLLGLSLSLLLISILPFDISAYSWIISAIFILVLGICAVKWCDFFIVISTSFNGAFTISSMIYFLLANFNQLHQFVYVDGMMPTISHLNNYLNGEFIVQHSLILLVMTILVALFGIGYQATNFIKDECRK